MSDEDRSERIKRDLERLLDALEADGVAGGTIGPDGLTMGEPNWEERTRDQRFSEKARTHGYPHGLAKGTRWKRDGLVASFRERVENSSDTQREKYDAVHEAVAWALDAERFLGSFNRGSSGNFPVEAVDEVADHLLVWLEERGFGVFPLDATEHLNPLVRETALYIDTFTGLVLDKPTHALYAQIKDGELSRESLKNREELNRRAAQWCESLRLSDLRDGEEPPPFGKVGQYGEYGCVLHETVSDEGRITHDVCAISYRPKDFGRFVKELVSHKYVKLLYSKVTDTDLAEEVSGLHPLSLRLLDVHLPTDLPRKESAVELNGVIEWGEQHSRQI